MLDEFRREKYLEQEVAVAEIERRFGDKFVYINQSGGQSKSREVLGEFRKLTGDGRVGADGEGMAVPRIVRRTREATGLTQVGRDNGK